MNRLCLFPIFLLSSSLAIAQSASEAGANLAKNPHLLENSANLSNPNQGKQRKLSEKATIAHQKRTQEVVHTEEMPQATPSFPLEENSEIFEEQVDKHEPKAETEKKRPRLKRPAAQLELFQKEKERLRKPILVEAKKIEAKEKLANIDDEFFEETLD